MISLTPALWIAFANLLILVAVVALVFRSKRVTKSTGSRLVLVNRLGISVLVLASASFTVIALTEGLGLALRFVSGAYFLPLILIGIIRFRIVSHRKRK